MLETRDAATRDDMGQHGRGVNKQPQQTSIEAIEKVALELFEARGFRETSADDIAAAAGISSRRTTSCSEASRSFSATWTNGSRPCRTTGRCST
jgi:hypothetical protein